MTLAALACLIGPLFRIPVVVDRHTTFLIREDASASLCGRVCSTLQRFTLRRASLTIFTNAALANMLHATGGRAAVLPDRFPTFHPVSRGPLGESLSLDFPASYNKDVHLGALLDACRQLPVSVYVYITGNYRRARPRPARPGTGQRDVLFEQDYVDLLFASGKALIRSDTVVLRDYFDRAIFVRNSPESIAQRIREFAGHRERRAADGRIMLKELSARENELHRSVGATVDSLG